MMWTLRKPASPLLMDAWFPVPQRPFFFQSCRTPLTSVLSIVGEVHLWLISHWAATAISPFLLRYALFFVA